MTLTAGTRLGAYEILSSLGAGGMGEVYRARDAALNRDVAIKIIRPEVTSDPDRLARFVREAQLLASLNHPHIAAIYGVTEWAGARALILELVEGFTLEERLAAGPLSVDEALPIARQLVEALDAAHSQGIVHRDLKPANIKLRPDGTVKVLDFGLAKAVDPDVTTATDPAMSPTMTVRDTMAGLILGTAAYMSPEQASGRPVDRRADIWAFGVVLYEMVTGRRLFEGETISHVLAAVLTTSPDLTHVPPRLRGLIARCLEKDPRKRLRDIGDAMDLVTTAGAGAAGEGTAGSRRSAVAGWSLAAALGVVLLAASMTRGADRAAGVAFPVLSYLPPPQGTAYRDFGFAAGPVVVSPDGRQLAFGAIDADGVTRLYIRQVATGRAEPLAGTEDASKPFWAPDGRAIGFLAGEKLKTVSLADRDVRTLTNVSESGSACGSAGAWSVTGTIVFTPFGCRTELRQIAVTGGAVTPATTLAAGEFGHASPFIMPDGRHVLYAVRATGGSSSVWMASLDGGTPTRVLDNARRPQFANGYVFFVRERRVFAQKMDAASGQVSGESTLMADAEEYSVSPAGVLAFQSGTRTGRLTWFDRNGNALGTVGPAAIFGSVSASANGSTVVGQVQDPDADTSDLWAYPSGGVPLRLTFGAGSKEFGALSPDERFVAYSCGADSRGICRKRTDGSGVEETLATLDADLTDVVVVDWSPDGKYLTFNAKVGSALRTRLLALPLDGSRTPFEVAAVDANQYDGRFSPDGRWIAYFSYETGRPEAYLVPFLGTGGKVQISHTGGYNLIWDRQHRLYYTTLANRLVQADLALTTGSAHVQAVTPLFQLHMPSFSAPFYDVTADGSRFMVVTSAGTSPDQSIGLLVNWPALLAGR